MKGRLILPCCPHQEDVRSVGCRYVGLYVDFGCRRAGTVRDEACSLLYIEAQSLQYSGSQNEYSPNLPRSSPQVPLV